MYQNSAYTDRSSLNLSRSLTSLPIAESTHLGDSRSGKSINQKATPKRISSSTRISRSSMKPSMSFNSLNLLDPQVYTDTQSRGLVSRLIKYHDTSLSIGDKSAYQRNLYSKPGEFPVVHLKKNEITYSPKRNINTTPSAVRIAPPDRAIYQTSSRSNILRSGSLSSLPNSLGNMLSETERNKTCNDNEPLTPSNDIDSVPTRSVLDALKEISRKRINNEEFDADRHKKQCKDVSEIDGFQNNNKKRARETIPPTAKNNLSPTEQNLQKKRLLTRNNDILSSLSSSIVAATPKRRNLEKIAPRNCIEGVQTLRAEINDSIFDKTATESNTSIISRQSSATSTSSESVLSNPERVPSSESINKSNQPTTSKITLFNKKYNESNESQKKSNFYSDDDEETTTINFVKPKNKMNSLDCGDVVRRVDKSKLSLMLSCLTGDFLDDVEKNKSVDVVDKPLSSIPTVCTTTATTNNLNIITTIASKNVFNDNIVDKSTTTTSVSSIVFSNTVAKTSSNSTVTSAISSEISSLPSIPSFNFGQSKSKEKENNAIPATTSTSLSPQFGIPITSTGVSSNLTKSPTDLNTKPKNNDGYMNFNKPNTLANVMPNAAVYNTVTASKPPSTAAPLLSFGTFTSPKVSVPTVTTIADTNVTISLPSYSTAITTSSNPIIVASFNSPNMKSSTDNIKTSEPTVTFNFSRPVATKTGDLTTNKSAIVAPVAAFGSQSNPTTTVAPVFGTSNNTLNFASATKNVTSPPVFGAQSEATLSFGQNKSTFNFGSLAQPQITTSNGTVTTNSFSFGKSTEITSNTPTTSNTINFGGLNKAQSAKIDSAFNIPATVPPTFGSITPSSTPMVKPSGGFSFNPNPNASNNPTDLTPISLSSGIAGKNPFEKQTPTIPTFGSSSNLNNAMTATTTTSTSSLFSFNAPTAATTNTLGGAAASPASAFNFSSSTNPLNNNNTNMFGQASSTSIFNSSNNISSNSSQNTFGVNLNPSNKPVTFGSTPAANTAIFGSSNTSLSTTPIGSSTNNNQNTFGSFGNIQPQQANSSSFIFGGGVNNNTSTISAFSSPPTTAPPPFGATINSNNSISSTAPITNAFGFGATNNTNAVAKPFEFGGSGIGNAINSSNTTPQATSVFGFGGQQGASSKPAFSFGGNTSTSNETNQPGGNNSMFKFSSNNSTNNNNTNLFGAAAVPASNAFAFGGGGSIDNKPQLTSAFSFAGNTSSNTNSNANVFGSNPNTSFPSNTNNNLSSGQFNFNPNTPQQQQQQQQAQTPGVFNFTSPNNINNNSPFGNVAQPPNTPGAGMFSIGVAGTPVPAKRPIRVASRRMK